MKSYISAVLVLSLGICINAQELTCQNGGGPTPDGTRCECLLGFKGEACEERTIESCTMMPDTGPCKALFPRFYYDSETKTCESFNYGGCKGNANNFETKEDCEKTAVGICTLGAVCGLQPETGRCRARITRYYFDMISQTCKTFIYGGCDGNANNFETEEECIRETRVCNIILSAGSRGMVAGLFVIVFNLLIHIM